MATTGAIKRAGSVIVLTGPRESRLGASQLRHALTGETGGDLPALDFDRERRRLYAVLEAVRRGLVLASHDISEGGLAVAALEMALGGFASQGLGLQIPISGLGETAPEVRLYSESPGFLLEVSKEQLTPLLDLFRSAEIDATMIGHAAGTSVPSPRRRTGACRRRPRGSRGDSGRRHPRLRGVTMPRVVILQIPGVNCEYETARILEAVGLEARIVRSNEPASVLGEFDAYVLPGGFAFQDRIRAGAVAAKLPAVERIAAESERGKPVLGICNGAQVLVEAGLVPGLRPGHVEMALAPNHAPRRQGYLCRWVRVRAEEGPGRKIWGSALPLGEIAPLPMAHGEGRFETADPEVLSRIQKEGLALFRYVDAAGHPASRYPDDPNGAPLPGRGDHKPIGERARDHAAPGTRFLAQAGSARVARCLGRTAPCLGRIVRCARGLRSRAVSLRVAGARPRGRARCRGVPVSAVLLTRYKIADLAAWTALETGRRLLPPGCTLHRLVREELYLFEPEAGKSPHAFEAPLNQAIESSNFFVNPNKERFRFLTSSGRGESLAAPEGAWGILARPRDETRDEGLRARLSREHPIEGLGAIRRARLWWLWTEGSAIKECYEQIGPVTGTRRGLLVNPHAEADLRIEGSIPWRTVEAFLTTAAPSLRSAA